MGRLRFLDPVAVPNLYSQEDPDDTSRRVINATQLGPICTQPARLQDKDVEKGKGQSSLRHNLSKIGFVVALFWASLKNVVLALLV